MSTPQLSPGTVIDGRFTIGNVTRTRGGATIHDATDAQAGPVSLTIYSGDCFSSGLVLERSLRELRQLTSVASPRLARLIGVGKLEAGGIFEATETLPPQTLAEVLTQGSLPLTDAAGIAVQVGEALLEAQRVGVMHRNLGADNLFPSPVGVKVTGFAVGEPLESKGAGPLQTIAPEQVEGKVVDQRTLVYNVAALMHWMLSGAPLFSGDRAAVLAAVALGDLPAGVDAKLHRALGRDARMRPMMLQQFLNELANMGGVEPPKLADRVAAPSVAAPKLAASKGQTGAPTPAASKPSSRGWTMFMKAADDEPEPAPAPAVPAGKPSTRGWTMFMNEDGENVSQEAGQEPAAPAGGEKTSTRGWTMFTKATEGDAAATSKAAAEPPAASAPAPPSAEPVKTSTRGWTMFMNEDGEDAKAAPAAVAEPQPAVPQPAAAAAPQPVAARPDAAPQPAAAVAASPPAGAPATGEAKPTTRGWTMFMNEDGEDAKSAPEADAPEAARAAAPTAKRAAPSAAAAVAAAPTAATPTAATPTAATPTAATAATPTAATPTAATPTAATPTAATPTAAAAAIPTVAAAAIPTVAADATAPPSSRGWTMFMDKDQDGPAAGIGPDAPPLAPQAPVPTAPAASASPPGAAASADGPGEKKKRGWTMFMDAPIAGVAEKPQLAKPAAAAPAATSDKKGWTVFGEPSPLAGKSIAEIKAEAVQAAATGGPTVVVTDPPSGPVSGSVLPPAASAPGVGGSAPPSAATVLTSGAEAPTTTQGTSSRGHTVIASGPPSQVQPASAGSLYFKKGESEPEGTSPRGPTAQDIKAPSAVSPALERDARSGENLPPVVQAADLPARTGGSKVPMIVVGTVVLLGIASAVYYFVVL